MFSFVTKTSKGCYSQALIDIDCNVQRRTALSMRSPASCKCKQAHACRWTLLFSPINCCFPLFDNLVYIATQSVMATGQNDAPGENEITFQYLRDTIIGPDKRARDNLMVPRVLGASIIKSKDELFVERMFESCAFKTGMAGVAGFGLGAALGLFSASVGPDGKRR